MSYQMSVQQLKMLKPGQTLIYYRGNFEQDVDRCKGDGKNDPGVPQYAALLLQLQTIALELAVAGKIVLSERLVSLPVQSNNAKAHTVKVIEYLATGLNS